MGHTLIKEFSLAVWLLVGFQVLAIAQAPPKDVRPQASNSQTSSGAQRSNILLVLADDWSYPHAGIYGDPVARTPNFDRVARQGMLFNNAYCAAPTCTASRAAILTGRYIHELESGANLFGPLPTRFMAYPDVLQQRGYHIGYEQKGWGPGCLGERTRNPAGPRFKDFKAFLDARPSNAPWCYWLGSTAPHRPYVYGSGFVAGFNTNKLVVPPFMPDLEEVRMDLADYYANVEKFDRQLGIALAELTRRGELQRTLVIATSDNGMPFIRSKANCYDAGTHMPLAAMWSGHVQAGVTSDEFVSLVDLAPTFIDTAGVSPPGEMKGRSLLPLLTGKTNKHREVVFTERERHANMRAGNLSYPCRSVRTHDFLLIWNLRPDRWPVGDPAVTRGIGQDAPWGDVDDSPTRWVMRIMHNHCSDPKIGALWTLAFDKRPEFELYDLKKDPAQLRNIAQDPIHEGTKNKLLVHLKEWMKNTHDPRYDGGGDAFDQYSYCGPMVGVEGMQGAGSPD